MCFPVAAIFVLPENWAMNEITTPEWIKRRKEQNALASAKVEATTQRAIVLSLRIKAEGLEFWRRVVLELLGNVNALPEIGAHGRISTFGNSSCRVDVEHKGSILGTTYTDLFFTLGKPSIECRTLEGDILDFAFCILPDTQLGVVHDYTRLNVIEMAEMIVQQCVKRLWAEES